MLSICMLTQTELYFFSTYPMYRFCSPPTAASEFVVGSEGRKGKAFPTSLPKASLLNLLILLMALENSESKALSLVLSVKKSKAHSHLYLQRMTSLTSLLKVTKGINSIRFHQCRRRSA